MTENTEKQSTSFLKKDRWKYRLHTYVMNKIMTTYEQCKKYYFVALLSHSQYNEHIIRKMLVLTVKIYLLLTQDR